MTTQLHLMESVTWSLGPAMLGTCNHCGTWDVQVNSTGVKVAGVWFRTDLCGTCIDTAREV